MGFEVGLIQEAMTSLNHGGHGYTFFLRSIPYSFYPLLTLLFVYLVAFTGRDFGPMREAELTAREERLQEKLDASGLPVAPADDTEEGEAGLDDTGEEAV